MEDTQRAAGRRVTILNVAISDVNGEATFWSDLDYQAHEWGSSLLRWNRGMSPGNSSRVRTVSLDWLLRTHLLPAAARYVVAKVDIEGAEYDALPPAIESICQGVDVLLLGALLKVPSLVRQRVARKALGLGCSAHSGRAPQPPRPRWRQTALPVAAGTSLAVRLATAS